MGIELRYPNINAPTEREQLTQLKSYLYQLVGQLQFALNGIDGTASGSVVSTPTTIVKAKSASNAQATFESIKSLIIKSADIVGAYYEEINKRLEGEYMAQSDFGTFVQQTSQDMKSNSEMIGRSFTNIQEISNSLDDSLRDMKAEVDNGLKSIEADIEGINHTLIEVNANIRSGLLYYNENGIPVYGLEVGQRTMIDGVEVFDKYARFTSDKLSFYDQNDNEVAYISDRKLYINHAEIKGTFRMGGFVKTVLSDGSIVKRWVSTGGEG